jgi:ubiquinone/menaquinone biosynthesis C-methylase UbiE
MNMDYDCLAAAYAKHRCTHPDVLKRLLEEGRLSFTSRILEVGCGTGNYTVAIEEAIGSECWGVDPSWEMMAKAKSRAASGRFKEGRAECLDFPDGFFDLVFSVDVIHHVEDRPAHFREASRILRSGGLVCTVTDSEEIIRHREPLSTHFPETIEIELRRYPRIVDLRAMMSFRHALTDIQPYRNKAFSSLHLIEPEAFDRGLQRLEQDLHERGSVPWWSRYVLLWGTKP